MTNNANILIVDDTADSRLMLSAMLEGEYNVDDVASGEQCLIKVEKSIPDLILLDVEMPGLSGYEVCVKLRTEYQSENLPIIFVSGLDSYEERLAGFEAGADDYIVKPVEPEILFAKVSNCLTKRKDICTAKESASEAMSIAMEAMTVSSELGQVVQFIKDVQSMDNPTDVGQGIIDILSRFGINAVARVDIGTVSYVACNEDSLEGEVLTRFVQHSERISSVGIRTVIRDPHIVLLIKDMPLDDDKRCGRFRDHMAVLMDIADAQLANIKTHHVMLAQRQEIFTQVIAVAEAQIKKTTTRLYEHEQHSQGIMLEMVSELEAMLFGLGLEEDQEKELMMLADQTSLKLQATQGQTKAVSGELGLILENLYDFFNALNEPASDKH